jgi:probable rRNA maturation factor
MPPKNKLSLSVQYPDPRLRELLPRALVRRWVQAALLAPAELTIRFVDADEGRTLNRDYRAKDYATNVLTFAYSEDAAAMAGEVVDDDTPTQADIILCTDVLQREAAEQRKTLAAHAAHLVVHGVMHAQGYDHETDAEAVEMEALEIEILARLGVENPYHPA